MNKTSISDLKVKAKDQLLGNYGIATGSFALLFVLVYVSMSIIMGALTAALSGRDQDMMTVGLGQWLMMQAASLVIGLLSTTVTVGYLYILKRIADGERPVMSDLFFVFRNHPDKIIIISLVLYMVEFILLLPANIVSLGGVTFASAFDFADSKKFLTWTVLFVAGYAISIVIYLMFAMSYMIYLDDPDKSVASVLRESVLMMRGNKFRYFYMVLTFIGYWVLMLLSAGIAALWVIPYQTMAAVEFYYDLKESSTYAQVEEL